MICSVLLCSVRNTLGVDFFITYFGMQFGRYIIILIIKLHMNSNPNYLNILFSSSPLYPYRDLFLQQHPYKGKILSMLILEHWIAKVP